MNALEYSRILTGSNFLFWAMREKGRKLTDYDIKIHVLAFMYLWKLDNYRYILMLGGIGGQEEKGMTEDEMAGWHHWLDGRESEWTPGVGDGQGGLACCDSWGLKESDTTERLNWTELNWTDRYIHVRRNWLF